MEPLSGPNLSHSQSLTPTTKLCRSPTTMTKSQTPTTRLCQSPTTTTTPSPAKKTLTTGPGLEMSQRTTCSTAASTSETNGTTATISGRDRTAK